MALSWFEWFFKIIEYLTLQFHEEKRTVDKCNARDREGVFTVSIGGWRSIPLPDT